MTDVVDAVIIGAGFGGLGAAIRLKQEGFSFIVIEKEPNVGGTWLVNVGVPWGSGMESVNCLPKRLLNQRGCSYGTPHPALWHALLSHMVMFLAGLRLHPASPVFLPFPYSVCTVCQGYQLAVAAVLGVGLCCPRAQMYPGAACDVESNLYSFSFAQNPDCESRGAAPRERGRRVVGRCSGVVTSPISGFSLRLRVGRCACRQCRGLWAPPSVPQGIHAVVTAPLKCG
jgi:cation diffusion facilitator CzcD-associated flavoprotein CzcO